MLSSKSKNVVELNSKSTSSSDPEKFKRKTSCVDCGKKMEFNDYFEQDHADWEVGSSSQHVRCPPCFEKFVQKEVLPNHHGRLVKKRKLKESSPDSPYHFVDDEEKEPKETSNPVAKKKKKPKKKRTKCKCVSTTHLSVRSKHCPLNKKMWFLLLQKTRPSLPTPMKTVLMSQQLQKTTITSGIMCVRCGSQRSGFSLIMFTPCPQKGTEFTVHCPVRPKKSLSTRCATCHRRLRGTHPTRADLVQKNAEFFLTETRIYPLDVGQLDVVSTKKKTVCLCHSVRLSEAPIGTPNVDNFMIHYVMKSVREMEESNRETAHEEIIFYTKI